MAEGPGRGRGRGLLMARLAAKKADESSKTGETSSDTDTTVSDSGRAVARGRGSLLRQLQSQR